MDSYFLDIQYSYIKSIWSLNVPFKFIFRLKRREDQMKNLYFFSTQNYKNQKITNL